MKRSWLIAIFLCLQLANLSGAFAELPLKLTETYRLDLNMFAWGRRATISHMQQSIGEDSCLIYSDHEATLIQVDSLLAETGRY